MVNPRTFFDFSIDDQPVGRVIFELFVDSTPKTCENFRALCTGEKGLSASGSPLYYKKSILHRCIKDFMLQGGDFVKGNGMGGESIYGSSFADEDLNIPLDSEGLLCMANKGPNTNGSQFFITLRPCPHLNGKHVVFGRVVKGYDDVIKQLANISVDEKHRPTTPIVISNCGELELRKSVKRPRSKDAIQQKDSTRSRSTSPNSKRRSIRPKKSHKLDKPDIATETEEEYDARLEREEKERLEAQRREALQRIKAKCEQDSQSTDGIRFKGRGRMKFIDPEIGQQRP